MRWANNVDIILNKYILLPPLGGKKTLVLVTLMAATLVIWTMELQQEIGKNADKSEVDRKKNLKRDIILPLIILISPLPIIGLISLIIDKVK